MLTRSSLVVLAALLSVAQPAGAAAKSRASTTHVSTGLLRRATVTLPIDRLTIEPSQTTLLGPRAHQALLVSGIDVRGGERDFTKAARFVSLDPTVARVTPDGTVLPVSDGTATIKASIGPHVALAAVRVRDARKQPPISFKNEIIPVLTRAGCNQGACHGAQYGKGGFKLSLLGYDPDFDHEMIVRQGKARRLSLAEPDRSLLLRKASADVPHGGGLRFAPDTPEYRLLARWIAEGASGPVKTGPRIVDLEVLPSQRTMSPTQRQQLVVRARFSDGALLDVTAQTRLTSLNDGLAQVTPEGEVTALGPGETAIMARYLGFAAVSRVTIPYREDSSTNLHELTRVDGTAVTSPIRENSWRLVDKSPSTSPGFVDPLVERKWRMLGVSPSPLCSDEEFIRRAGLDAVGTLPTPEEVRAFLADQRPDKRARLVEALLARPEYADYWALKWGDLLRVSRSRLGEKGMWSFYNWLHGQLRSNRPVDAWVRELITAQGSTYTTGPANFYRVVSSPPDLAETTSQVFLGVRLQCARCHQHPFEKWSQEDYYSLAAYFARVRLKGSQEFGIFGGEQVVRVDASGEVRHPKTSAEMRPRPLDGSPADDPTDRRRALAAWITGKNNHYFARNVVNRYWAYLMGRGIVEPVDDMRVTNPPTNPDLLDALARDFIAHGYDLKALLRTIMTSRVYQLSSTARRENQKDEVFFSHYLLKRIPAEALLDAISAATGTVEKFPGLPRGTRAIQLPDAGVNSYFLDTFGRPPREIACECERTGEPNMSQALQLMNGEVLNGKIGREEGRIPRLLSANEPTAALIRELYLSTLSRLPRPIELATALRLVSKAASRKEGAEDLLWTLLNTREFLFNH